jgi:hypothetical protein
MSSTDASQTQQPPIRSIFADDVIKRMVRPNRPRVDGGAARQAGRGTRRDIPRTSSSGRAPPRSPQEARSLDRTIDRPSLVRAKGRGDSGRRRPPRAGREGARSVASHPGFVKHWLRAAAMLPHDPSTFFHAVKRSAVELLARAEGIDDAIHSQIGLPRKRRVSLPTESAGSSRGIQMQAAAGRGATSLHFDTHSYLKQCRALTEESDPHRRHSTRLRLNTSSATGAEVSTDAARGAPRITSRPQRGARGRNPRTGDRERQSAHAITADPIKGHVDALA